MAYPDYPLPGDEALRQRSLEDYGVLDSPADQHFERLVQLAAKLTESPIALISLIDRDRQWFLARHGLDVDQTPREMAFCAHAITGGVPLVVPDARLDARFSGNPLVTGAPHIRFYAGVPLPSVESHNLGTLCVIDSKPRMISEAQLDLLQDVAGLVLRELDLRRLSTLCSTTHVKQRLGFMQLAQREVERGRKNGHSMALLSLDIDNFNFINQYYGYGTGDHVLRKVAEFCSTQLRPRDLTGRIGADEFAILLENVNLEEAQERAEAIRCGIEEMKLIHGSPPNPILVSVSCGLTIVSDDESSIDPALQRSAAALRLAQRNGRNQVAHHLA